MNVSALTRIVRKLRSSAQGTSPAAERRVQTRLSRRLPVTMLGFKLESTNVTSGGMQLECPARRLALLRAQWDPGATPLRAELPGGETIDAVCAVSYVCECEDDFLIGLGFVHLDERSARLWEAHILNLNRAA